MKKIVEVSSVEVAKAFQQFLANHGVKSDIAKTSGRHVLQVSDNDEQKAAQALKAVGEDSAQHSAISFRAAFAFSLAFILFGFLLFSLLDGVIHPWIILAIISFAGTLTIINLPVVIRTR